MQTRSSDENSVCLSVRPSVKRVNCDKTEEKSVQIFIPHERSFSLVFWEKELLLGGDRFYLKFWVNRPPLERNRRFWTELVAPPASAVIPSEKSSIKGQLQWKKSNRQNYKRREVYLKTSYLRNLVYHCNVCTRRKKNLKFMLSNEPSTNFH